MAGAVDYYWLNAKAMTFGECWRMGRVAGRPWYWLRVWLRRIDHHPLFTLCCPAVWPAVAETDLPAAALDRLAPAREQLVAEGFAATDFGRMPTLSPTYQQEYCVLMLSADGHVGVIVTDTVVEGQHTVEVGLTTRLTDDRYLVTHTGAPVLNDPDPDIDRRYRPGWRADDAHTFHRHWLAGREGQVVPFRPAEAAPTSTVLRRRSLARAAARGHFILLDAESRATLRREADDWAAANLPKGD